MSFAFLLKISWFPSIDMIPGYIDGMNLAPGGHRCTLEEVRARFGVGGPVRSELWAKLTHLMDEAKKCGFQRMILGGSFVTAKMAPGDLDITWFGPSGLTKEKMRKPCADLADPQTSRRNFGCDLMYMELSPSWPEQVDFFANEFGWDTRNCMERGTLILELA